MTPEEAYQEVVRLSREHALVYAASSGVVIIIHPDTQKEEGMYEHIQWVHGLGPHPRECSSEDLKNMQSENERLKNLQSEESEVKRKNNRKQRGFNL